MEEEHFFPTSIQVGSKLHHNIQTHLFVTEEKHNYMQFLKITPHQTKKGNVFHNDSSGNILI